MSDYRNIIVKVINSDITGYKIYKKIGISQSVISGLRNGDKAVDDLTLKTTEKLYTFFKEEMNS